MEDQQRTGYVNKVGIKSFVLQVVLLIWTLFMMPVALWNIWPLFEKGIFEVELQRIAFGLICPFFVWGMFALPLIIAAIVTIEKKD